MILWSIAIFAALYLSVGVYWLLQFFWPLMEAVDDPWELAPEILKIVFLWPFTINR
jgi:hypothetical protein